MGKRRCEMCEQPDKYEPASAALLNYPDTECRITKMHEVKGLPEHKVHMIECALAAPAEPPHQEEPGKA